MRLLLTALFSVTLAAQSYPPPFPRPNATKLFETDRIVVWNIVWPIGQPSPMHKHVYDQVGTYYIAGGRTITSPDGSKRTGSTPVGNISTTRKGTLHIEEGATDPPLHAVFIELKYEAPLQGADAASEKSPPFPREGAKQVFDDERVTIWDYAFTKGSRPAQRYDRDTLIVFLGDGYLRWTGRDGQPAVLKAVPGQVRYFPRGSVETEEVLEGSPRGIVFKFK